MKNYLATKAIGNESVSYLFDNTELTGVQQLGQLTDALQLGDATASDYIKGQYEPNVQSALVQLGNMIHPINSTVITTSATSPSGVSFQEDIAVSGVTTGTYVTVYGKNIPILESDSDTQIAEKIETYFAGSDMFRSVTDLNGGSIRITHKDNMRHEPYFWEGNGLTLSGTVYQQSATTNTVYFGTWDLLGTETKFGEDLYYWRRTA